MAQGPQDGQPVYVDDEGKVVNVRKIGASDEGVLYTMQFSVSYLIHEMCLLMCYRLVTAEGSYLTFIVVITDQKTPSQIASPQNALPLLAFMQYKQI
jgi:hypothetical protein